MANLLPFLPLFDQLDLDQPSQPPSSTQSAAPAQPPDAQARAQALDIHTSFIVEAPAGSGKTGLLIQRFLKLLADDSVASPEQVLAITFTTKATGELRDRVLAHLAGAPGLDSETWDVMPLDSGGTGTVLQLAASAEPPAPSPSFAQQTSALAQAVLTRDRQLGWNLLDHPHRLNIRTIDAVCAEIARTLPVLSGSGGRLTPLPEAAQLLHEAARRTLLLLGNPDADPAFDAALRDLLLHRDGNLADCESLLADMLSLRDQWGELIPLTRAQLDDAYLDTEVLPRLQHALEQAICIRLAAAAQAFPADLLAELADIAGHLGHAPAYTSDLSPIAHCAGIHAAPHPSHPHLDHWKGLIHLLLTKGGWRRERGLTKKHLDFEYDRRHRHHLRLADILDQLSGRDDLLYVVRAVRDLPAAQYPADQWRVAKSLFRVLSRALVELQLVFAARGQCDFTELSLLARAALNADSGPEDLASALGARLQHLLVDEMQDTSASQYDLIQLLTASWDGHSQTVFLVGDPRQSIYLFRHARVARFLRTMRTERLGDLPLTHLQLTANFRSQQTLVDDFNHEFSLVFPPEVDNPNGEGTPYTNAHSTRPPSPDTASLAWHPNPIPPGAPPQTDSRLRWGYSSEATPAQLKQRQAYGDARQIRRIVERWLAKPLPTGRTELWRIAVLVRSRTHLTEIASDFDNPKLGPIPYRAVDITPLNERQEVLDLTALTRALLHPADRVAWLAILRAPWCGLSLADLHLLTGADDPNLKDHSIQRLIDDRGHLLGDESIARLKRLWQVMSGAAAQRTRLTPAQLVERVWRSLGGDAWLTAPQLTNAHRFFQLLDEIEAEGSASRVDSALLNTRLERLFAEPNSIPPGQPFVELLTIHKAKGLEWDVVVVPALERSPGRSPARLLTWAELDSPDPDSDAAPILLAPIAAKGEEVDALTAWLKRIHRQREHAERKHLFYVACTRAREELHLFAAPDLSAKGEPKPRWDSLLRAAWAAAQPHFAAALDAATTLGDSHDAPGAPSIAASLRWVGYSREARTAFPDQPEPFIRELAASMEPSPTTTPIPHRPHPIAGNPDPFPAHPLPILERLPLTFDPAARFTTARTHKLPYGDSHNADPTQTLFTRPEGSFAARSFGNAVHTFLEILATRLAAGSTAASLLAELPAWTPRIAAILRADGLPPATVAQLTRNTRAALENALRDPDGLWLLSPHAGAAYELALIAWNEQQAAASRPTSIRIDRLFHAGPEPHAPGEEILWIVDYKTTSHGPSGLDGFMQEQRAIYAAQLETYAATFAPTQSKSPAEVRLALYYPAIPHLIWWKPPSKPPATG